MDKPIYTITAKDNENVFIHAMQGHFVTASSHLNYYIGTSDVKHNHDVSSEAAKLLARYYHENNIECDTVLCLYETHVLGAYLAHELSKPTMLNPNPNNKIYVIGPEYDNQGNIIFRDNLFLIISLIPSIFRILCSYKLFLFGCGFFLGCWFCSFFSSFFCGSDSNDSKTIL